jgi:hypothetical protein
MRWGGGEGWRRDGPRVGALELIKVEDVPGASSGADVGGWLEEASKGRSERFCDRLKAVSADTFAWRDWFWLGRKKVEEAGAGAGAALAASDAKGFAVGDVA